MEKSSIIEKKILIPKVDSGNDSTRLLWINSSMWLELVKDLNEWKSLFLSFEWIYITF